MGNRTQERQELINRNIRNLLDPMQKLVFNHPKLDTGNLWEHEQKKSEICYNCQKDGLEYICEARLKSGGKPDILILDLEQPIAYEIVHSESEKSIFQKEAKYNGIKIIVVRT